MNGGGHWRRLSSRYLYESRWYKVRQDVVRLPNGNEITYTAVEHPGYVLVVPVLADDRVVMEHVYRYTLDAMSLECPSGGTDGEPPDAAARRELREETGYAAGVLEPLGWFDDNSGISNVRFHVFLATDLVRVGEPTLEETEEIRLDALPMAELLSMVHNGTLTHAPSALALLLAEARRSARDGGPAGR